ncbi:MAG: hypothetical protein KF819_09680 [Labilithrix sp.]|nr:hypothetical protein [Labilithrix sp.]
MSSKRLLGFLLLAFALVAACAENVDMGDIKPPVGPTFTPPGAEGGPDAPVKVLACTATTCPAPFASCISEDGPTYKCGTDLMRDNDHCGACGSKCLVYAPIHMTSRCIDGACELECHSPPDLFHPVDWRNCNGLVDDGCEINVLQDPKHCGQCGNACAPGTPCIEGRCGCLAGKIACNGVCTDPRVDDNNCGACGNVCTPPAGGCAVPPPNAYYGCRAGACNNLKCIDGAADCNGDLSMCNGDGCETFDLESTDNCGGCGIKCAPGESCVDEGNGLECAVPCKRFGKTLCPGPSCVDLLTDVGACGSCGLGCKAPGPNQTSTCKKGLCAYECQAGFADCNGDPEDGCETNLRIHPGHCGACGQACDLAAGQPCIEGQCLMRECDPGETR